jgi:hypothetical protein
MALPVQLGVQVLVLLIIQKELLSTHNGLLAFFNEAEFHKLNINSSRCEGSFMTDRSINFKHVLDGI